MVNPDSVVATFVLKSTEPKPIVPTLPKGKVLWESDTDTYFAWDGAAWIQTTFGSAGGGGGGGTGDATKANQVLQLAQETASAAALGTTTDAKVTGDNGGTVTALLRGINWLIWSVTNTVSGWFRVSVEQSALPTGAATATLQGTGNTSLSSIDGKIPALGQAVAGSSVPAVLPAAQITTLTPPPAITNFATETGGNLAATATVLGSKTDAANTATNSTSVSAMSVWKQISLSVQTLVTNLGTLVFGAGTAAASQRVTLASDDPAVAALGAKADAKNSATDTTPVSIVSVLKQISASVQALVTGTVLAAGTALIGKMGIDQTTPGTTNAVAVPALASGGYSKARYLAQTTTVQVVKATGGKLAGWFIYNPNATAVYMQLFDLATGTTTTLGTTPNDQCFGFPPGASANMLDGAGIDFALGIKLAISTGESNNTAPALGCTVNVWYK